MTGRYYGVNSVRQKHLNHGLVLKMIATGDSVSRIDISRRIGLTKMAVTNIVGELIAKGYAVEKETVSNAAVGRNPVVLDISPRAPKIIGVYISRLSLTAILADMKLRVLHRTAFSLCGESAGTLTDKLYAAVDRAFAYLKEYCPGDTVPAIGVSAIGPLDSKRSVILNPRDFFGISNYAVGRLLGERYGLPVISNNDMNAAALAENLYGIGRQTQNFFYMGLTAGVGSGIVSQGELFQNRSSFVGEIGHMSFNVSGAPECSCGMRGCLEQYVSIPVVTARLGEASGIRDLTYDRIGELWGDTRCTEVFDEVADKLSVALTNVVNLLDPRCIVIGHEGVYLPDECLCRIESFINSHILAAGYSTVNVVRSGFGDLAPLAGSACCVLEELFGGNLFGD